MPKYFNINIYHPLIYMFYFLIYYNFFIIYFIMNIQIFLKGILIGIAKIIPGLSGSVLMISFNLYDKAIDAITNFFSDVKRNFTFLLNISLGILIGIVMFSNILNYFIKNYYVYTTSLFIGLILGGIPLILGSASRSRKGNLLVAYKR